MKPFLLPLLTLATSFSPLQAEIVFETKLVELTASPDQKTVTGEFPFTVKGQDEMIKNYEAKCTCLEARVEPLNPDRSPKLKWKAGESGKIVAKFDATNFRGTVDKAIVLNIVGQESPISLITRVTVPELVELLPHSHKWDIGSAPDERIFKIKINHTEPINIVSHSGNNPNFEYELKTIKKGWEYEVSVKPKETASAGIGMLSFRTDSKFARFNRAIAYVVVRPERNENGRVVAPSSTSENSPSK